MSITNNMGYFLKNLMVSYEVAHLIENFKDSEEYNDLLQDINTLYPKVAEVISSDVSFFNLPNMNYLLMFRITLFVTTSDDDQVLILELIDDFLEELKLVFISFLESKGVVHWESVVL